MTIAALSINRLIQTTVSLQNAAPTAANLSTLLVLGPSPIIDVATRIRSYTSLASVADDFGGVAPEYLQAALFYDQMPAGSTLYVGRWAQTATSAQLYSAPFTATLEAQLVTELAAVNAGSLDVTIDGVLHALVGMNFTNALNLNGVAAILQTALSGLVSCVWNPVYGQFVITSGTTGAASTITFATAGATGTNVSGLLGLTQGSGGAYVVQGIAPESALAAVQLFDSSFGQLWFGLHVAGTNVVDEEAISTYIQGSGNAHYYVISTTDIQTLNPGSVTDIASIMSVSGNDRTAVQYNSSNLYAGVSLLSRILAVDYTGNNTVISLMYKQEPGVTPDNLTSSQISTLESKNANAFVTYDNNTAIIEPGVSCAGVPYYIDTVVGMMQLSVAVQAAVYAKIYGATKIPQTDAGMHILTTVIDNVLQQFVTNGLLAPGVWEGNTIGALNTGDTLSKGYYIFAPSVSAQLASARAARVSVPIQIAAKLAGAVQTVSVAITLDN